MLMNSWVLHTAGSSKLCRKTHIDIANKAQVNIYATGHHEVGSSVVDTVPCPKSETCSFSSVPPSISPDTGLISN